MTKISIHIPDELIAMSQRNPFRELNDSQDRLGAITEAVTIIVVVVLAAASGSPSNVPSSVKTSVS